jgi:ketose-bisphosphate aldolase
MLTTLDHLLRAAQRGGYAVGAFDLISLETGQALLEAAEQCQSPIILMIGPEGWAPLPYRVWMPALRDMARQSAVPAAITLDHGPSYEAARQAIEAGATGAMYDGSLAPLEENVRITRQLVELAHRTGVSVEAEIGCVGNAKDFVDAPPASTLTDPQEAARFVEVTGVDALAVAIGTAHGVYRGTPVLDFERLARIRQQVSVPLVLHGGSRTPHADLQRCIQLGICKINIFTDLVQRAGQHLTASMQRGDDIPEWLRAVNAGFREVAAEYLRLFGCAGKAPHNS